MTRTTPQPATNNPQPTSKSARLRWTLRDIPTNDNNRLTITFQATIQALPNPADRQLFAETFGPTAAPDSPTILAHFTPALTKAATTHAQSLTANDAVAPESNDAWIAALRTAANATAFAAGLELLAPFTVDVSSPTLQQAQLEQMQTLAAERRSASRLERLDQGAKLLEKWEQLRAAAPSLSPGQLLGQLAPSDQGPMLETLLLASAAQGAQTKIPDLWAVAGPFLIRIEHGGLPSSGGGAEPREPQLIPLPTTLGPLRSVTADDDRLLIGAQRGIFLTTAANPSETKTYTDPDLQSDHGFSAIVSIDQRLIAIHRDGGIVMWTYDAPDHPARIIRPADLNGDRPRQICTLDQSRTLIAAGPRLLLLEGDQSPQTVAQLPATIVTLHRTYGQLAIATEDGAISLYDPLTFTHLSRLQPANRIATAATLPWLGTARLLLASDGPIISVGLDDQLIMQYAGAPGGVRAIAATHGKVAAMSADRQRILLWNAWDGRTPAAALPISTQARHRIADLTFA